jgi:hypothetical protein
MGKYVQVCMRVMLVAPEEECHVKLANERITFAFSLHFF